MSGAWGNVDKTPQAIAYRNDEKHTFVGEGLRRMKRVGEVVSGVAQLLGRRQWLMDLLLALLLILMTGRSFAHSDTSLWVSVPLTLALVGPISWRRRYPVAVFAVIALVALAQWSLGVQLAADVSLLVAFYTVASRASVRYIVSAALTLEVGVVMAISRWGVSPSWLRAFIFLSGLVTAAGALGIYSRTRQAYLAELQERAERAERERDQQGRLGAAAERARIAREMHDIIAHHLAVVVALSEGAVAAIGSSPRDATQAMSLAAVTSRQALAETRRVLGVLRAEPENGELRSLSDTTDLNQLIDSIRAAGLRTTLSITGQGEGLSAADRTTIYRIVQEALTNVLKHAGPGAETSVRLNYAKDEVELEITDAGAGKSAPAAVQPPGGHGLAVMRERVEAWGGHLVAGPIEPNGWRVHAVLRTGSDLAAVQP